MQRPTPLLLCHIMAFDFSFQVPFLYFILFLSITSRHFSILQDIYQFTRHFILLSFKLHCPVVELFFNLFDTTKNYFVSIWIELKVTLRFQVFFFFSYAWTVQGKKNTVYALFTNYSCTVYTLFTGLTTLFTHLKIILLQCFQFSVFSFSNNKLNPNGPSIWLFPYLFQRKKSNPI